MKRIVQYLICFFFLTIVSKSALATDKVVVYFFWGEGCPHCAAEKPFLEQLKNRYPQVEVKMYEVFKNKENEELLRNILILYEIKRQILPMTFIGDFDPVVGYFNDSVTGAEIEEKVRFCIENRCKDPIGNYLKRAEQFEAFSSFADEQQLKVREGDVKIPLLRGQNSSQIALPVLTVVIALLDSFNPCAFFVLTFLLSLLTHLSSSKKMLIIGGTFIFFSAIIYFLFMSAWLNLFFYLRKLRLITLAAGIVAVSMAVVNIKDFVAFNRGISLTISDGNKQVLFKKMRSLVISSRFPAMIAGAAALAVGANCYELLCTAGFPMVYTKILTLRPMKLSRYYLYLFMYNTIYIIPLLLIVIAFVVTLGSRKMTEWQGRVLKLISGVMMISLGSALIINPAILSTVLYTVLLVTGAIVLSLFIAFLTRIWYKNT